MSDPSIPLALLAHFHREVILPDIERIVGGAERRLRDEMHGLHDAVLTRLDRLEFEYQAIRAGIVRLEERLEGVEQRLERVEQRLERVEQRLERVEQRLDVVEAEHGDLRSILQRLDERLSRLEKRLDDLVSAGGAYASRTEVLDLRARLDGLQARVDALARRRER